MRDFLRGAAGGLDDAFGVHIDPVSQRVAHRNAHDAPAAARGPVSDRLAPVVVDADDRGAVGRNARDQPLFDGSIVVHGAVAIEMVLRQIDQDPDRRVEARGEVDLE